MALTTSHSRRSRLGIWLLVALAGVIMFVLGLPVLFGWRDLDQFGPEAAVAWGSYLNLQLLAGGVGLVCFGAALSTRCVGWYLLVALFGGFTVLGMPAAVATLLIIGRQLRWGRSLGASLLFTAGAALDLLLVPETEAGLSLIAVPLFLASGFIFAGALLGIRRRNRERRQQLQVAGAQSAERTRISRDIHDSLSHRLALIAIHSGAMEYRDDLSEGDLRRAASTIREQAEMANAELHEILTVLRTEDSADEPGSSTADIIESARRGGNEITVGPGVPAEEELRGGLSTLAWHAVYRTLQESLRNAALHAPGQPVHISAECDDEILRLWVTNEVGESAAGHRRGREPGYGLVGLRERAELAGGRLWVDRTGGFRVGIEVPWTPAK